MRIVVVEDEFRTRSGIVKLISSLDGEFIVVGEAENGAEGICLIEEKSPDLVITDIKMPLMDGLEMLRESKCRGYNFHTVVLSGYAEFDFAQKAMSFGVKDYLLKPVEVEDIEKILRRIYSEIHSGSTLLSKGNEISFTPGKLIEDMIISNNISTEKYIKELERVYSIDVSGKFCIILLHMGSNDAYNQKKITEIFTEEINKYISTRFTLADLSVYNEVAAILSVSEVDIDFESHLNKKVLYPIQSCGYKNTIMGCITFTGLINIKENFDNLRKQLKWTIVFGSDVLVSYHKVQIIKTIPVKYPEELEQAVVSAVLSGDIKKLTQCSKDFLSIWGKDLYMPEHVSVAFIRFTSSIINAVKQTDEDLYNHVNHSVFIKKMADSISWQELEGTFNGLLEALAVKLGSYERIYSLVVRKALNILNEKYPEIISLEGVAEKLDITPEYLSTIFNREVGMNFSTYLKELRIRKAKELMLNTSLKIYEIAGKVGYQNPKYFHRVFKESTGMSTKEFLNLNK